MFKKSYVYFFKATASAATNNIIATCDESNIICGIIKKNSVHLIKGPDTTNLSFRQVLCIKEESNLSDNSNILSTRFICLKNRQVLAILKEKSFYLYEADGSTELTSISASSLNQTKLFCCFTVSGTTLFIGNDAGDFLRLEISLKPVAVEFKNCISGHRCQVVSMVSEGDWLTSADDEGTIQFWRLISSQQDQGGSLELVSKFSAVGVGPTSEQDRDHVVCLALIPPGPTGSSTGAVVLAGCASGRLLLVSGDTGCLLTEVAAHARLVSGLALHCLSSSSGPGAATSEILAVTVAEDSLCRVWRLGLAPRHEHSNNANGKGDPSATPAASITLIQSIMVPDQMLQGVAFTGRKGCEFVITSYDSNEAVSFVQL